MHPHFSDRDYGAFVDHRLIEYVSHIPAISPLNVMVAGANGSWGLLCRDLLPEEDTMEKRQDGFSTLKMHGWDNQYSPIPSLVMPLWRAKNTGSISCEILPVQRLLAGHDQNVSACEFAWCLLFRQGVQGNRKSEVWTETLGDFLAGSAKWISESKFWCVHILTRVCFEVRTDGQLSKQFHW